jgi:hypothetical protein
MTKVPKKRLNLELTEEANKALENLRVRTKAESVTEVIRRAINLYDFVKSTLAPGEKIIIRHTSGDERELIIL